jgi:hypothetical protein
MKEVNVNHNLAKTFAIWRNNRFYGMTESMTPRNLKIELPQATTEG